VSPDELLAALAPEHPRRADGAHALLALLRELAAGSLRAHNGDVYRIPPNARDEVVAEVAYKVIDRSPLPIVGKGDERARSYLRSMMINLWISTSRRRRRETALGDREDALASAANYIGEPDGSATGVEALERLFAALRETRPELHRQKLDQSWKEILELHGSDITTRDLIERDGLREDEDPGEFKRRRNAMFKAHERLRRGLVELVDAQQAAGQRSVEDAAELRRALSLLWRCQRRTS
jgi:DNA-directed RNA polymerase specialized sigma24 family protein